MGRAAIAGLICTGLFPALAEAQQRLPETFLGSWKEMEGKLGACSVTPSGPADHSDTRVRITPGKFEFHEGACTFGSVRVAASGAARVLLSCQAEGESYRSEEIWQIKSIQGQTVLAMTKLGAKSLAIFAYQRCGS